MQDQTFPAPAAAASPCAPPFELVCLTMEGDTELGLVVKNTLDALELPVPDLLQWARP